MLEALGAILRCPVQVVNDVSWCSYACLDTASVPKSARHVMSDVVI